MKVLDLFSGIGAFSLGLERAGLKTIAFCEIEPFCRQVLAKHWPEVPCYHDIRELDGKTIAADVICGGFPCQDISVAGRGAGITGKRSGLWREYARIIGEVRPRYVIVENSPALLGRGLGVVLGDLSALGYDAEWHCVSAANIGAPHIRDRIWIVAYTGSQTSLPNSDGDGLQIGKHVSIACEQAATGVHERREANRISAQADDTNSERGEQPLGRTLGRMGGLYESLSWHRDWPLAAEPTLGRGVDGPPYRLDRVKALGNGVVPQIPEAIGKAILAAEAVTR